MHLYICMYIETSSFVVRTKNAFKFTMTIHRLHFEANVCLASKHILQFGHNSQNYRWPRRKHKLNKEIYTQ